MSFDFGRMIHALPNPKLHAMDYLEFVAAALAAAAVASLVYVGMAATGREHLTSLDVDMLGLAAMATFVSAMVAKHPEWLL